MQPPDEKSINQIDFPMHQLWTAANGASERAPLPLPPPPRALRIWLSVRVYISRAGHLRLFEMFIVKEKGYLYISD